jgi:hypothetical protein
MISFVLLGSGVACFVACASLLAGLLRSAKASSQVTEEQQDQSVHIDEQDSKEELKSLDALRSVS